MQQQYETLGNAANRMLIEEVVRACLASVKAFQRLQHDYNERLEDRNWAGYKRAVHLACLGGGQTTHLSRIQTGEVNKVTC